MVHDLLKRFQEKQTLLPDLLKDLDSADLKALDAELSVMLEQIFTHHPQSVNEFRSLMKFFLDLLVVSDGGGDHRIILRMEELVEQAITISTKSGRGLRVAE